MKKFVLLLAVLLLSVCAPVTAENQPVKIVTTIFPIYDWVRQIVGPDANVDMTMLLDSGVDLHNYQPTAQDILKIAQCDLFIFVGGESDEWTEDVLATAQNKNIKTINLLDALGEAVKEEEIVEGMEAEHEHGEDHDHDHEEEEEIEYDEHVWLSLRNAEKLVAVIADALAEIDAEHADAYRANAEDYLEKLQDLDAQYAETVNAAAYKTVLFGDRFPFRYLVGDYGLSYYAAFSGCSAETEASFQTILFLAQKVDELNLPAVLTIEHPTSRIAQAVVSSGQNQNAKILAMDSMQSTTAEDVKAGASYLTIMENNLVVLKEALN